jgi:peroxiredoxin
MIELGQLEKRHDDFDRRNTRIIAISVDNLADSQKTQGKVPNLIVLSDEAHALSEAAGVIHPHAGPNGSDTDAPTTILVDRHGQVRWLYRPEQVITRLSPDEVLKAIDEHMK